MQTLDDNQMRLLKAAILLLLFASQGLAQLKPSQCQISQQTDDIVRVTTELVQAGVTVLDKEGELVNGLQREQFELYIDGKPQPILFFESIFSGTKEERQIESSAVDRAGGSARKPDVPGLDPGRTVFFFVDDLHLAPGSLWRTRQTLLSVINETMGRNDHWAVVSTSGQIGFLQQITNNRAVMHAAVERLNPIPDKVRDGDRPPITEYAALMINEQ